MTAGTFLLGFLLTLISVDVAKVLCGRPRPTFIEACRPDWSRCDADAGNLQQSSTDVCRQTDQYVLLHAQWVLAKSELNVIWCSAGASLNEPPPPRTAVNEAPNFWSVFRRVFFSTSSKRPFLVLTLHQIHLYGPLYLALSNMALSLHRQIKPFTTNCALSGPFTPWWALRIRAPPVCG